MYQCKNKFIIQIKTELLSEVQMTTSALSNAID